MADGDKQKDPYAEYGGSVATQADPYAQYQETEEKPKKEPEKPSGFRTALNYTGLPGLEQMVEGVGAGALQTVGGVSRAINKLPYVGETLAPSEGINALRKIATPENTPQRIGAGLEQMGELYAAGPEKGANLLAKMGIGALGGGLSTAVHEAGTEQGASPLDIALSTVLPPLGELGGTVLGSALRGAKQFVAPSISKAEAATLPAVAESQAALRNAPKDVLQHAEQMGVDLTPGQATGKRIPRVIQGIGERSLASGEQLEQAIQANKAQFMNGVQDFERRLDPWVMGTSAEEAGEHVRQAVETAKDIAHTNASDAYKMLPEDMRGVPVNVQNVRASFLKEMKDLQVSLANRDPEMANRISAALQRGANLGTPSATETGAPFMKPELSWQDAMKVRSDALADARIPRPLSRGSPAEPRQRSA